MWAASGADTVPSPAAAETDATSTHTLLPYTAPLTHVNTYVKD